MFDTFLIVAGAFLIQVRPLCNLFHCSWYDTVVLLFAIAEIMSENGSIGVVT